MSSYHNYITSRVQTLEVNTSVFNFPITSVCQLFFFFFSCRDQGWKCGMCRGFHSILVSGMEVHMVAVNYLTVFYIMSISFGIHFTQRYNPVENFFLFFFFLSRIRETMNISMCADSSTDSTKFPLFTFFCYFSAFLCVFLSLFVTLYLCWFRESLGEMQRLSLFH